MTDARTIPSVAERTRPVAAEMPVVAVQFLGNTAAFVLGEEALLLVAKDGTQRRTAIHAGAILAAAADGERIVTGGDDGKVVATDAEGESAVLADDAKHRWIDHVAVGPNGAVAWSAGKQAFARTGKGAEHALDLPSTVGGLAFAPKGFRLAAAHYNGVTLWYPNAREAAPETLEWKGSHLGAAVQPGRQVPGDHHAGADAARLAPRRPQGHAHVGLWRTRALARLDRRRQVARDLGLDPAVLWPFQGSDGPMGKTPRLLAPTEAQVEVVACHPKQEVAAVGYADGLVLIVRLEDGAEVLARKPAGAPVTALAWSAAGNMLAFGTEDGEAGVLDL